MLINAARCYLLKRRRCNSILYHTLGSQSAQLDPNSNVQFLGVDNIDSSDCRSFNRKQRQCTSRSGTRTLQHNNIATFAHTHTPNINTAPQLQGGCLKLAIRFSGQSAPSLSGSMSCTASRVAWKRSAKPVLKTSAAAASLVQKSLVPSKWIGAYDRREKKTVIQPVFNPALPQAFESLTSSY